MAPRQTRAAPPEEPPTLVGELDPYLQSLAGELEIDLGRLEHEMAAQAVALHRVGRALARAAVSRDARRRELASARVRVESTLYLAADQQGTPIAPSAVAARVEAHADVARLVRALDDAQQSLRSIRYLYRAFLERGRMLEALAAIRS